MHKEYLSPNVNNNAPKINDNCTPKMNINNLGSGMVKLHIGILAIHKRFATAANLAESPQKYVKSIIMGIYQILKLEVLSVLWLPNQTLVLMIALKDIYH